jgi:cyclopropane-fatty-acyl-phospholipid synthase
MFERTATSGEHVSVRAAPGQKVPGRAGFVLRKVAQHFADSPVAFEIRLPDDSVQPFGKGAPEFRVLVHNPTGLRALSSLDEGRFAEAYLAGDIDLEGDMLRPFALRQSMGDFHLVTWLWRFLQPLLMGQVKTNQAAISSHYDIDPRFFRLRRATRRAFTWRTTRRWMSRPRASSNTASKNSD